ncbi:MAG: Type 1 glutamine amidotransferase-like domain-containing protein, partial [Acidobacteriota bacterium]|nr:Type 1 glutamine amidotransferase-like domain-containing protein [Acidobacteriota bacterium]
VTAGWQERESEVDELSDHLDCGVEQLELYRRAEEIAEQDGELVAALRDRQQRLRRLQNLYRRRLGHHLAMVRELLADTAEDGLLDPERRDAIEDVRALDAHHLERVRRVHDEFEEHWRPSRREAVARHRGEIAEILARCDALVIAGGHVAVLLNRLRLFDLVPMLEHTPVVAWSAGAMVLSECIVLFHDSPPQGAGNAEILDSGLGLCPGIIPLPHARERLRLDDPLRVTLFAMRFAPSRSVVLERGSRLDWSGDRWSAAPGTVWLGPEGSLETVGEE